MQAVVFFGGLLLSFSTAPSDRLFFFDVLTSLNAFLFPWVLQG